MYYDTYCKYILRFLAFEKKNNGIMEFVSGTRCYCNKSSYTLYERQGQVRLNH